MLRTRTVLSLAIILSGASHLLAANVLLREQATHHGAVVYLGDVADIAAATASEVDDLVTTPLMAAPAEGEQEFLSRNQVRQLLIGSGLSVDNLSFGGAESVAIGSPVEETGDSTNAEALQLSDAELGQAVHAAIDKYLTATTGHADWRIEAKLEPMELRQLREWALDFQVGGTYNPRQVNQRLQITGPQPGKSLFIATRVERMQEVVVAVHKIEVGNLIGAADVELRQETGLTPQNTFGTVDQVIGKEATRSIAAGALLQANQMRSPLQVRRGETVKVFARTGGITVSTFAVVKQDGALGDLVQVETLDRRDRYSARVSGWKQLEVTPAGATATDIAELNRPETQLR